LDALFEAIDAGLPTQEIPNNECFFNGPYLRMIWPRPICSATKALPLFHQPVAGKQDYSTTDCNQEAAEVKAAHTAESDPSSDESAYDRSSNSKENRYDKSTWIVAWHQKFGQRPCDESEQDPR
jgi:hypothetical protein